MLPPADKSDQSNNDASAGSSAPPSSPLGKTPPLNAVTIAARGGDALFLSESERLLPAGPSRDPSTTPLDVSAKWIESIGFKTTLIAVCFVLSNVTLNIRSFLESFTACPWQASIFCMTLLALCTAISNLISKIQFGDPVHAPSLGFNLLQRNCVHRIPTQVDTLYRVFQEAETLPAKEAETSPSKGDKAHKKKKRRLNPNGVLDHPKSNGLKEQNSCLLVQVPRSLLFNETGPHQFQEKTWGNIQQLIRHELSKGVMGQRATSDKYLQFELIADESANDIRIKNRTEQRFTATSTPYGTITLLVRDDLSLPIPHGENLRVKQGPILDVCRNIHPWYSLARMRSLPCRHPCRSQAWKNAFWFLFYNLLEGLFAQGIPWIQAFWTHFSSLLKLGQSWFDIYNKGLAPLILYTLAGAGISYAKAGTNTILKGDPTIKEIRALILRFRAGEKPHLNLRALAKSTPFNLLTLFYAITTALFFSGDTFKCIGSLYSALSGEAAPAFLSNKLVLNAFTMSWVVTNVAVTLMTSCKSTYEGMALEKGWTAPPKKHKWLHILFRLTTAGDCFTFAVNAYFNSMGSVEIMMGENLLADELGPLLSASVALGIFITSFYWAIATGNSKVAHFAELVEKLRLFPTAAATALFGSSKRRRSPPIPIGAQNGLYAPRPGSPQHSEGSVSEDSEGSVSGHELKTDGQQTDGQLTDSEGSGSEDEGVYRRLGRPV